MSAQEIDLDHLLPAINIIKSQIGDYKTQPNPLIRYMSDSPHNNMMTYVLLVTIVAGTAEMKAYSLLFLT